jgi:hypothetical protein
VELILNVVLKQTELLYAWSSMWTAMASLESAGQQRKLALVQSGLKLDTAQVSPAFVIGASPINNRLTARDVRCSAMKQARLNNTLGCSLVFIGPYIL